MANLLLRDRDAERVGINWASRFVKRQPLLKTVLSRKYDYQRALCEDPKIIRPWFDLVRNTVAKYGILDEDTYNFDEAGFLMGQISSHTVVTYSDRVARPKLVQPGNREWVSLIQAINAAGWAIPPFLVVKGQYHLSSWTQDNNLPPNWRISVSENGWTSNEFAVDWIKHFDQSTRTQTKGKYRLLVLDGHESHHSMEFEEYCKQNNIITLCMPPHSSHLLQLLDVGCFGPLKKAYSRQIEHLMKVRITHITKEDFFPAFLEAFNTSITKENIQGGFRGAGLIPLNAESVISKLDVRISTPISPESSDELPGPWQSKTPTNPLEATSQSEYLQRRVRAHQSSSPSPIIEGIEQIAKGTQRVMHELILLKGKVAELEKANERLSKRRRAKNYAYGKEGL
uniref:DDE-1 domain-containing protein n=1 Tax=Bionectria ochroleuca TaxID=29856 RepID=A0A8H7K6L1_BIOOC